MLLMLSSFVLDYQIVYLSTNLKLSTCVIFEYAILSIDGIVVEGESLPNISVY